MNTISALFFKSLCAVNESEFPIQPVLDWIRSQKEQVSVEIEQIPFSKMDKWKFQDGALRHESGKFFSVEGLDVRINENVWQQPIVNQPEIGYLGFITKEIKGVLHFLIQAKIEPGNINNVQLSPTLQATKSNYSMVHEGNRPAYLHYFENVKKCDVLFDQLQSEHNSRFLKKRNRNIIIKVKEDIEVFNNFTWLSLGQIKKLMTFDNVVNMNTRTVIANIPLQNLLQEEMFSLNEYVNKVNGISKLILESLCKDSNPVNTICDIQHFITRQKTAVNFKVNEIPIHSVVNWEIDKQRIFHKNNSFFEIIAANIHIGNREVENWSQPLIRPVNKGFSCFISKTINGILHFLVQAKTECGNFDLIEFAPTVQTSGSLSEKNPFFKVISLGANDNMIFDSFQSEEGGRFYHEQNRNTILLTKEDFEVPDNFIWMTLHQLLFFASFSNCINIQARNLLAAISIDSE